MKLSAIFVCKTALVFILFWTTPILSDELDDLLKQASDVSDAVQTDLEDAISSLEGSPPIELRQNAENPSIELRNDASDDGAALFGKLKALNDELEGLGVKAFGELSEASYRNPAGEWAVAALKEDIEACRTEFELRKSEAAASSAEPETQTTQPSCPIKADEDDDSEGAKLFRELKELNDMVEERIYLRNGKWRLDALRIDIAACTDAEASDSDDDGDGGGDDGDGGAGGAGGGAPPKLTLRQAGEETGSSGSGKEAGGNPLSGGDRVQKLAALFGAGAVPTAAAPPPAKPGLRAQAPLPPPLAAADEDHHAC